MNTPSWKIFYTLILEEQHYELLSSLVPQSLGCLKDTPRKKLNELFHCASDCIWHEFHLVVNFQFVGELEQKNSMG